LAAVAVPAYQVTPRPDAAATYSRGQEQRHLQPTTYRPSLRNRPLVSPTPQFFGEKVQNTSPSTFHAHNQRPATFGRDKVKLPYQLGTKAPASAYPMDVPTPVRFESFSAEDSRDVPFLGIPGTPGKDYPLYGDVPETSFSCANQEYPGYYADVEAACQVSMS
jgi:hypothetical protein